MFPHDWHRQNVVDPAAGGGDCGAPRRDRAVVNVQTIPINARGPILSMSLVMAAGAKSYEILSRIITQSAPPLDVMDLKVFHAPA